MARPPKRTAACSQGGGVGYSFETLIFADADGAHFVASIGALRAVGPRGCGGRDPRSAEAENPAKWDADLNRRCTAWVAALLSADAGGSGHGAGVVQTGRAVLMWPRSAAERRM